MYDEDSQKLLDDFSTQSDDSAARSPLTGRENVEWAGGDQAFGLSGKAGL